MSAFHARTTATVTSRLEREAQNTTRLLVQGTGCADIAGYDNPETERSFDTFVAGATGRMVIDLKAADDGANYDVVGKNPLESQVTPYHPEENMAAPRPLETGANEDYLRAIAAEKDVLLGPNVENVDHAQMQRIARRFYQIPGPDGTLPTLTESETRLLAAAEVARLMAEWF